MTDQQYIEVVAKALEDYSLDSLYVEMYNVGKVSYYIPVLKAKYTPSRNYLKLYKKVFQFLPSSVGGLIIPIKDDEHIFQPILEGVSSELNQIKATFEKRSYARCTKEVADGIVIDTMLTALSVSGDSTFYHIIYTPWGLKQYGINEFDWRIASTLPCYTDELLLYIAKDIFVSYSYTKLVEVFENLCRAFIKRFLAIPSIILKHSSIKVEQTRLETFAVQDFYTHTKNLFRCYEPLITSEEERRVWHDVNLLCERKLLNCAVEKSTNEIACLNSNRSVDELKRLYKWLKSNKHIDDTTTRSEFIHYFRDEPGRKPTRKLLWTGHNKEVLFAVIELLHPKTIREKQGKGKFSALKVRTTINWKVISDIIQSPNIKIDRSNYRSSHRRIDGEIRHNKYEDAVNLIEGIMSRV
ncbi:MAG: hypothetical protein NC230_07060 [Bacteroides sp.]|nr:hypothetical protein [Bacteroides sp.]MCM1413880.1 hypothetical protein [Bacteroides sp.]